MNVPTHLLSRDDASAPSRSETVSDTLSPLLQADLAFSAWRRGHHRRARWGQWRRWHARRRAESTGTITYGLPARSPVWLPLSQTARSRRLRMSSHMRAWLRLGGASGGGDSDEVGEVLPVARSPAALRLKADEPASHTWCSARRMIASPEAFTGCVRAVPAPPPLLCKDLRGLLNDCATNDVLDAYMALLQRCQIAQASERPPRIAFCPCSVSQLHRHSQAGRLARRLASFVPLAGRLFIPWHIPGGPGGGGHY